MIIKALEECEINFSSDKKHYVNFSILPTTPPLYGCLWMLDLKICHLETHTIIEIASIDQDYIYPIYMQYVDSTISTTGCMLKKTMILFDKKT